MLSLCGGKHYEGEDSVGRVQKLPHVRSEAAPVVSERDTVLVRAEPERHGEKALNWKRVDLD